MTDHKGSLAAMKTVGPQHELFIITEGATVIRVKTEDVSQTGRATQGVKMMSVIDGDRVTAVARMTSSEEKDKAPTEVDDQVDLDSSEADGEMPASADERMDVDGGDGAPEDLLEE